MQVQLGAAVDTTPPSSGPISGARPQIASKDLGPFAAHVLAASKIPAVGGLATHDVIGEARHHGIQVAGAHRQRQPLGVRQGLVLRRPDIEPEIRMG